VNCCHQHMLCVAGLGSLDANSWVWDIFSHVGKIVPVVWQHMLTCVSWPCFSSCSCLALRADSAWGLG
jgi:hypothetical protein